MISVAKTVIRVKALTKVFDGTTAVDKVSFEVSEGEIVGLLGPNGAGKTTILQMLLGTLIPTSGQIEILGLPFASHREEILGQVNFSSTYVSMPNSLTVMENLMVFARLYGIPDPHKRIQEFLQIFEINHLQKKLAGTLSSGQLTRLCLAKALLNKPKILFLDEPTASLDPDIADKTRRLLKKIRLDSQVTILYTSHNMREMEEMCDRILFLNKGQIIAAGTPKELIDQFGKETLEEVFLKVAREEE
jgi:ABC-2 type transport system ATP-binding protein